MDKSCYRANLPYPEVCVEHKNKFYASLLLDDYASCTSEYTAIAQYVYAHVKTEDECIQDVFLGIAIVEMCHLDLLADVIIQLGANPKFYDGCGRFWRGEFVPYGHSTKDRLKLAIESEYAAILQYEKHIQQIKNCDIQRLLERIIMDEKIHVNIFKQILCELQDY
ncbi:bacterioferritin [Clostridium acidisoli DSM 12555]|uniref:Bacterioferritin n=1 Tax=Clostridium acidisoli DSM 12555 TaxID=1121291 RepID=A0A1W1XVR0_9CLOT|nr:ferritin family protein [Clostridium acidisoli]SMC28023.1 bacterioferritin [Clostridium acidisoli DSM 12555]